MKVTVKRSSLQGSMRAPPSKSATHRALFCAALAEGESQIHSALRCSDTLATTRALSQLDVSTSWINANANVTKIGQLKKPSSAISCGESGTTLRFMIAVCATTAYDTNLTGELSLLKRPVNDLVVALQQLGADCKSNQGYPPVYVKGPIHGGPVEVSGGVSSQYLSALMLAAPLAEKPVDITLVGRLESKPYVLMTLAMQHQFAVSVHADEELTKFHCENQAYQPANVEIEGDWSSAAFLLVAATIAGEEVRISGLTRDTPQGDQRLVNILEKMNGQVSPDKDSATAGKARLKPIEVDVSDSPDLFPSICALCAVAEGASKVTGIRRLRTKESDRVNSMSEGLRQMGIECSVSENSVTIRGGRPHGATINPHRDHRIAMAFTAIGLGTEETVIDDAECVEKSYPSFWRDIHNLGADVTAN